MTVSVSNVTASKPGVGGAISVAPTGTTLPTSSSATLDSSFVGLGYVSEDGVSVEITRDSEEIKAWGGDTVLTPQTGFAEKFKFKLIESLKDAVRKTAFGDSNVTGSLADGLTTKVNSSELAAKSWVIDTIMNGAANRIVIPNGKVTEIGEIVYVDNEPVGYELTVTALPDSSGNCSYEYTVATASSSDDDDDDDEAEVTDTTTTG